MSLEYRRNKKEAEENAIKEAREKIKSVGLTPEYVIDWETIEQDANRTNISKFLTYSVSHHSILQ